MTRLLAAILFLFEPFLAASLLLRVGPSLIERDALTWAGVAARVVLALASVVAAIGLRGGHSHARMLSAVVLLMSAAFATLQYVTRLLPTSLAPDVALFFTILLVLHHAFWIAWLMSSGRSFRRDPRRARDGHQPLVPEETSRE